MTMQLRSEWFIHLRPEGLRNGDKHAAYTRYDISQSTLYLLMPIVHFRAMIRLLQNTGSGRNGSRRTVNGGRHIFSPRDIIIIHNFRAASL